MAYYKARMKYWGDDGSCHIYHAYCQGYDKEEAIANLREELCNDEKEDTLDILTEINEAEYRIGYERFGDGIRN